MQLLKRWEVSRSAHQQVVKDRKSHSLHTEMIVHFKPFFSVFCMFFPLSLLSFRYRGTFEQILVFDFGESCISRPLSYQVLEAGEAMLAPSAPFQKPARRSDLGPRESREGRVVVPGRRVKR